MLTWCSYCQQFMGEVPPYDRLAITHSICTACEPEALELTESDFAHALKLRGIQEQLAEAGRQGDLQAAARIIGNARNANVGLVDILVGIIAPMLYQIGEEWQHCRISIAQEHRFTAFCEGVYRLIAAAESVAVQADATRTASSEVLLINAPGNTHTLAIRILALWLARKDIPARALDKLLTNEDLIKLIGRIRPGFLVISMALAEQAADVITIAERIADLPEDIRPSILVGGYAVKLGLVSAIPGASFMADIGSLVDFVHRQRSISGSKRRKDPSSPRTRGPKRHGSPLSRG